MRKNKKAACLTLMLAVFFWQNMIPCPIYAQEDTEAFEELRLYVGQPKVIQAVNPKRVAVARPEVADVASVAVDEVVLEPKSAGVTSLFIWDDSGQRAYQLKVFSEDLSLLKEHADSIIRELDLPGVVAKINESEGKIILAGEVSELNEKERLLSALASIKDNILDLTRIKEEEATLDIAVEVLEMNRDASRTLGFTMPSSISVSEPARRFSSALRASMDAIFHVFDWPRADFAAKLDALIEEGKARVLSSPRLACQSGKEAELLVGGEKPLLSTNIAGASGGLATSISYKEFGIKLKIKPTVTENQRIKVGLNIEVSEVGDAEILGSANAPTAKAFPLSKRSASTELFLENGQTLGIGGLVKEKEESLVSKTAFLGDIPILGMLFRRKTAKIGGGIGGKGNVELVILLTPKIVPRSLSLQRKAVYKDRLLSNGSSRQEIARALDRQSAFADGELGFYAQDIRNLITSSLRSPDFAGGALGARGTVKLRLRILSDGQLKDALVTGSSGNELLDTSAVNAIKKLAPFPPFSRFTDAGEVSIDIPIVYN